MGDGNGEWSYHLYGGSDPGKRGTYVKCASHPCHMHGSGDIIATGTEDAYAKAHSGDASPGLDTGLATESQMRMLNGGYDVEGSKEWAKGMRDADMLDDDPDDRRLFSSYDEFLLNIDSREDMHGMRYLSVELPDGGHASLTESDMSPKEAEMLSLYALRDNDESEIGGMPDDRFARLVFDGKARGEALDRAEKEGFLSREEYVDENARDRRLNDIDLEREEGRW